MAGRAVEGASRRGSWVVGAIGLVVITVLAGWYWPLVRAHRQLSQEYLTLTSRFKGERRDWQKERMVCNEERGRTKSEQAKREEALKSEQARLERFQRDLLQALREPLAQSELVLELRPQQLLIDIVGHRLIAEGSVDLATPGRAVACEMGKLMAGYPTLTVMVEGRGTDIEAQAPGSRGLDTGWDVAGIRAARLAFILASCGAPPSQLRLGGHAPRGKGDPALRLRVVPATAN